MGRVIGIDLGTTNSCVAILDNGEPLVIPNTSGSRTTPSVVAVTKDGERLVGAVAKRHAGTHPEDVIFAVKRLMGREYDDEDVQRQKQLVPYRVIQNTNGDAWVQAGSKDFSPPEVSAMILTAMRDIAQDYLSEEITEAVITVPAYFDDAQRAATKAAGKIAGLDVKRIINEPTAAALAYGFQEKEGQRVVVYDLGGGTFDVSILEIRAGVFRVISTSGDTHLGGEDIDNLLVEELAKRFKDSSGIDVSEDRLALQRIREQAERAKQELSTALETEVNLPFLGANESGPQHLQTTVKRSELEILTMDLVDRTLVPCKNALEDAKLTTDEIDEVLLVGGQTRMPLVRRKVTEFFGKEPHRGVNPDEVVASGAALQGAALSGEVDDVLLLDVTPLSLGVETGGGIMTVLIERNTTVPTQSSQLFTTSLDNQPFVPVHILQGERQMAADNKSLAKFELAPIPPAPRGVPEIEVTFEIDANGMVDVKAKDLRTGREQGVRVVASSGLSEDDISKIIADAESYKESDELRKELAELKNHADTLLFTTTNAIDEFGELVPDEVIAEVQADVDALKAATEAEDADALSIREALQALELSAYKIAEAMYGEE